MQVRVNRNLLKLIIKLEQGDVESYRLYVIARAHFSGRSGVFSLDDLCDVLHKHYNYKSLHRRAGNKRAPFKAKLALRLGASVLFRQAPDGRQVINAERKILNRYRGTTKSSWYELPSPALLAKKRDFSDFCIGVLLAGNKFRANKNVAGYCNRTVRRVQLATMRNHKNETFIKQFNFIESKTGSYNEIERQRAVLLNIHGITSPLPVRYKDEWILRLNAPNSYQTLVLSGVKGYAAHPTKRVARKEECWFRKIRQRFRQLEFFDKEHFKRWVFNEKVYNIDRYVQDNSAYLNLCLTA